MGNRAMEASRHREQGFTFPELVIAVCLIGLVAAIVLPRVGEADHLGSTSRRLIGSMRTLYDAASVTKLVHRLYFDLDQQTYWAVVVRPDGERPPLLPGLADRNALPPAVRLLDVITPAHGKVLTARAVIQFTPGGRTDRSMLHLRNEEGAMLTLQLNPLTGSVRVLEGYAESPPPDPLPEVIKTAMFGAFDATGAGGAFTRSFR